MDPLIVFGLFVWGCIIAFVVIGFVDLLSGNDR